MPHYRDDLDAARARIETLEAKLRERDAAVEAREAELAELRAEVARARGGAPGDGGPEDGVGEVRVGGQRALLIALAACGFATATGYAMVRTPYCYKPHGVRSRVEVAHEAQHATRVGALDVPDVSFDRSAAARVLAEAARLAADCAEPSGPTGRGRVTVTFEPSGAVRSAEVLGSRFAGTAVGSCVEDTFHLRTALIPAFDGAPVTVSKSFNVE